MNKRCVLVKTDKIAGCGICRGNAVAILAWQSYGSYRESWKLKKITGVCARCMQAASDTAKGLVDSWGALPNISLNQFLDDNTARILRIMYRRARVDAQPEPPRPPQVPRRARS